MSRPKRILLVSMDLMVLQTRKLMLGAYFDVQAAGRVPEARSLLGEQNFDLVILCYTLSQDDCQRIVESAQQHCPRAKILMLTAAGHVAKQMDIPRYFLAAEAGPFVLVKRSAELLGFEFRSKGRMVQVAPPNLVGASSGA
jgi:DNA-binding NarL/FixJ family response regulator